MRLIITLLVLLTSAAMQQAYSASSLPDPDLSWKNVSVAGSGGSTHSLHQDKNGLIWVGTNNGLCFYDGIANHRVNDEKLAGTQIYSIVEHENLLLLGTNNGLFSFNLETGAVEQASHTAPQEIRCMLQVDKTLWIGSLYGVYTINLENGDTGNISEGLPHKSTYSIIRDSRGIIYAGTFNGLAKWDAVKNRFRQIATPTATYDLHNLFVNCLMESADGNALYIGSEGALYRYQIAADKWESVPYLDGNNIKCLASTHDNQMLIGTDNGLFHISGSGVTKHYRHDSRQDHTLADNEIWCMLTDKDNNIWAGHDRGFSISSHSSAMRMLQLSTLTHTGDGNEIHNILRDRHGDLWLGGTNGILQLTKDNRTIWHRHDNSPQSLSHNRVRAITEDSGGNIWLSTDGGLNRFDRERNRFDVFHIMDARGTHNTNWVYALEEDDDSYWIGGFLGGLHRVAKSKFTDGGGVIYSDLAINADTDGATDNHRLENDLINDIVKDRRGNIWILLFRDDILACYTPATGTMTRHNTFELSGNYPSMIEKDHTGRIWCAFKGGAIIFSDNSEHSTVTFAEPSEDESPIAMGAVGKDMWISTQSNIWKIDGETLQANILPVPQKNFTAIYEDTLTGNVILGGTDEIMEINPDKLSGDREFRHISFVLVKAGDAPVRQYNPDGSEQLTIPYGGNLTLTVSSLDYSPETAHRYMYKLAESENDTTGSWSVLPEGVNTISLTDLKMGNYEMLIKRVGMSDTPISIPLHVKAPLLLSWWAILVYLLMAAATIYAIVMYLHQRNQRRLQEDERRKALENVERKLTFLSGISHDLKTPLSMILGPVSLMKERARDPETKKTLDMVYNNAVRLNNMIHKTIELHHLEDDEDSMLILSTLDVVDFCKGVFETFRENNLQKNFVFHSSCEELLIEADAVKFESVMTNLLSNACKYSEDGATISCGIIRHDNTVEIVVSDDGVGIEEADQPLVFQRMFRAPSTAKLREGTGLGLYLIKKYLELMHGNINLYSKKGLGTSFIVTLPVADKAVARKSATSGNYKGNRPKILLVEDNAEISSFIQTLTGDEYTMLSADNGRSGLAIASSFLPDLIIADEMMPIMTGLEMCRRMKQNPRLAFTPIIMLTAKADNHTENESVKLGIDIFMPKPFDPNVLLGRIRHLLKSRDEIRENMRIQTITEAKPIEAESTTEKQLAKIAKIIEENVSDPDLNVNTLCEKSGMPQKQLYRIIKRYIGVAPLDYIRRVRLQKAAMLLSQKRFTVSEISYMVGFKTPSYFAKCFQAQFGVKPSQYRSDDETETPISDIPHQF